MCGTETIFNNYPSPFKIDMLWSFLLWRLLFGAANLLSVSIFYVEEVIKRHNTYIWFVLWYGFVDIRDDVL
jgi:hypothetical protein